MYFVSAFTTVLAPERLLKMDGRREENVKNVMIDGTVYIIVQW